MLVKGHDPLRMCPWVMLRPHYISQSILGLNVCLLATSNHQGHHPSHTRGHPEGYWRCTAMCQSGDSIWDRDPCNEEPPWRGVYWCSTYGQCFQRVQFSQQGSCLKYIILLWIHTMSELAPMLTHLPYPGSSLMVITSSQSNILDSVVTNFCNSYRVASIKL